MPEERAHKASLSFGNLLRQLIPAKIRAYTLDLPELRVAMRKGK